MATFELYRYNSGEFGWRLMDGGRVLAANVTRHELRLDAFDEVVLVREEAPHALIVDLTGE